MALVDLELEVDPRPAAVGGAAVAQLDDVGAPAQAQAGHAQEGLGPVVDQEREAAGHGGNSLPSRSLPRCARATHGPERTVVDLWRAVRAQALGGNDDAAGGGDRAA